MQILILFYAVVCIFGAAVVRGYSGFGFSLLAVTSRASMIAFFLMTDVTGLAWQGWSGLLSVTALWRALLFLPALTGGIWLGNRGFRNADPVDFRRWVLRLLILLAVLAGGRALTQIL
jgi:hypothetical protein